MDSDDLTGAPTKKLPFVGNGRLWIPCSFWLRGLDLNQGPLGYEPNELPDCSTPQLDSNNRRAHGSNADRARKVDRCSPRLPKQTVAPPALSGFACWSRCCRLVLR